MMLVENEVARWYRDGYLHLSGLLPAVVRDHLRRWIAHVHDGEGTPALADDARGISSRSAAQLARHHSGLSQLLGRGLLPHVAGQLLGSPARPADGSEILGSRLTCVLGLDEDAKDWVEFAVGRGSQADPTWVEVPLEAGDVLWVDGRAPQRRPLRRVLYLDYRAVEAQATFPWPGERRGRA